MTQPHPNRGQLPPEPGAARWRSGHTGARTELTWVGHATVLVETRGVRLLTDPVLGRRVGLLRRIAPPARHGAVQSIDAVLLSHLHSDHADLPSLLRIGRTVPVLGPPAVAEWLRGHGFVRVRELTAGAATRIGDVTVEATPARHDGRRWPRGPAAEAVGFLVRGGASVYFAGDTDLFPEMASLAGHVDVALLPVWGWGPDIGPGHLDPERAAQAAASIRPRVAIPIHWGTLARPWSLPGPDARAWPARAFAAAAARTAPGVQIRLLEPGERMTLDGGGEVVRTPGGQTCIRRGTRAPGA